ncbi:MULTISPECIES: hypothetical protein [Streptomyces]|uniref:hypothetical protein n=1 Tax=Streptomyces TaxID=1883 RepID=UPI0023DD630B|nr:hypothetical protein [Streptomyces sp. FXJ1.172]WEP00910.1 hypothetical protein A6P39_042885 [Streptomyces sp. FXJ1.172]
MVAGTPASAAISNHRVQLCAQGNYDARIHWSTGYYSTLVHPGECQTFDIDGTGGFVIGGVYNVSRQNFDIQGVASPRGGWTADSPGMKFGAEGTSTAPYVVQWANN